MSRYALHLAALAAWASMAVQCGVGATDGGKPGGGSGAALGPVNWIVPLSLTIRSREVMPLAKGIVSAKAAGDAQPRAVAVRLVHTVYLAHVVACRGDNRKESTQDIDLYELLPMSDAETYEWSFWYNCDRFTRVASPQLLTTSDGRTYLTWVRLAIPFFVPVSEPVERMVALQQLVDLAGYPVRPVGLEALGDIGMWHGSSVNADVEIVDITRSAAADWVVKVRVPHTGKEYVVAGQGNNWRKQ